MQLYLVVNITTKSGSQYFHWQGDAETKWVSSNVRQLTWKKDHRRSETELTLFLSFHHIHVGTGMTEICGTGSNVKWPTS